MKNTLVMEQRLTNRKPGTFPLVLGVIFCLFIGILAASWIMADKIDPVILDEKGHYRSGGNGTGPSK